MSKYFFRINGNKQKRFEISKDFLIFHMELYQNKNIVRKVIIIWKIFSTNLGQIYILRDFYNLFDEDHNIDESAILLYEHT